MIVLRCMFWVSNYSMVVITGNNVLLTWNELGEYILSNHTMYTYEVIRYSEHGANEFNCRNYYMMCVVYAAYCRPWIYANLFIIYAIKSINKLTGRVVLAPLR